MKLRVIYLWENTCSIIRGMYLPSRYRVNVVSALSLQQIQYGILSWPMEYKGRLNCDCEEIINF